MGKDGNPEKPPTFREHLKDLHAFLVIRCHFSPLAVHDTPYPVCKNLLDRWNEWEGAPEPEPDLNNPGEKSAVLAKQRNQFAKHMG